MTYGEWVSEDLGKINRLEILVFLNLVYLKKKVLKKYNLKLVKLRLKYYDFVFLFITNEFYVEQSIFRAK